MLFLRRIIYIILWDTVGSSHNPHLRHPNLRTDCKDLRPPERARPDNERFDHNLVEVGHTGSPAPVAVEFLTFEDMEPAVENTGLVVEEVENNGRAVEERTGPVEEVARKEPAAAEVENMDKPELGERQVVVDGRLSLALDFDGLEHIQEELEPELEELAVRSDVPRREQRVTPHVDARMAASSFVSRRGFRVHP